MRSRFLVFLDSNYDPNQLQGELVDPALESFGDASEADASIITLTVLVLRSDASNGGQAVRVDCEVDEASVDAGAVLGLIESLLQELEHVRHAVKIFDERVMNSNLQVAERIFRLEGALREALTTLLLVCVEDAEPGNLLAGSRVKTLSDRPSVADLYGRFENDLWYVQFSEYKNIGLAKVPSTVSDLIELARASDDFDTLRKSLSAELQIDEVGSEFLASIRDSLESIEKARNSVAHNRQLSARTEQNFAVATERIESALLRFMQRLNEGGRSAAS